MPGLQSLYAMLNVSPDADWVVVEAAHKALMKKYHPDRGADAANLRRAASINEAFSILKDPKKRADYEARSLPPERMRQLPAERAFMAAADARPSASLKMVAWSGWLTAIAVGIALAVTVKTQNERQPYAAYGDAQVSEPEKRAADSASIDPGLGGTAAAAAPVVGTAMVPASLERLPSSQARPQKRFSKARKQRKAARRSDRARAAKSDDREFLEREGYIY